jgi:maltose O-acetyltransferase
MTDDAGSRRSFGATISYEAKMWVLAALKPIPGQVGCALRRSLLPGRYGDGVMLWDSVHIDEPARLTIGTRTSVNRGCILHCGGGLTIGADVLIGPGVVIYSQNHRYEDAGRLISEQGYDRRPVRIEDGAWIAARAVVLPGVTVGRGAVVAAGAVVTRDVEPFSVVAGVPARVIGARTTGPVDGVGP